MFVFFYVMNDYGFPPSTVCFLNDVKGWVPAPEDVYNPLLPNNGNSNMFNPEHYRELKWGMIEDSYIDTRLFYATYRAKDFSRCRWDPNDESIPRFYRISPITNR